LQVVLSFLHRSKLTNIPLHAKKYMPKNRMFFNKKIAVVESAGLKRRLPAGKIPALIGIKSSSEQP